jgi:putative drug exporter of the RND superfamily
MARLLYRLGSFSYERRQIVALIWLVILAALVIGSQSVNATTSNSFSIPGTEGQRALDLLAKKFPGTGGATARIVFAAPKGHTLAEPQYQSVIAPALAAAEKVPQVLTPSKPLSTPVLSKDKTIGFADLQYAVPVDKLSDAARAGLDKIAAPARKAGLTVAFSGGVTATSKGGSSTEVLGVLIAAVILMVTFGSVVAAGLPLFTALIGVGIGLLGIQLLSGFISLSSTAPVLALMLGLAVGIDYALFIVSRHRQQLNNGMELAESVATAVATAGSAVVFAGLTVFIALAGMVVVGIPFLSVMGLAAAGTVVVAVLIALTLLPAMLGFAGARANKGRKIDPEKSLGNRWVHIVTRQPLIALVLVIAGLLVIAIPALHIRLALPDDSSKPKSTTERQAYDLLTKGFGPGFTGPLTIVVDSTGQKDPTQIAKLVQQGLAGATDVAAVSNPIPNKTGEVSIISVTPKSSPSSEQTKTLVNAIRARADQVRQQYKIDILVTGTAAINIDVSDKLSSALPVFLILVVGLALLLLLLVFRSIAVPLKAVAGFLLTIASSLGLIVFIFQEGHLGSVFAVAGNAPIISFLPILMIAILFGLAMDYEVFLVSRMREDFLHTGDALGSTITGFRSSARVVTAAGLIMISVFSGFVLADDPVTKSIGLALAFGVLVDAFLVRMTLVPAVLALLGRRSWALPGWLDRLLPHVDIEGAGLVKQKEPAPQA